MTPPALLMEGRGREQLSTRMHGVLAVMGVDSAAASLDTMTSLGRDCGARVLGSASSFLALFDAMESNDSLRLAWREGVHSAFVCADGDTLALAGVVRRISDHDVVSTESVEGQDRWHVSNESPEICHALAGVRVRSTTTPPCVVVGGERTRALGLVSRGDAFAFGSFEYLGVRVFVSTGGVIDTDAPLASQRFDVRTCFFDAAPIVLYVQWAFGARCWHPQVRGACLVIDDPPLWPRFGYVEFRSVLSLMSDMRTTASVAFVPWNCNRTDTSSVDLFASSEGRLSLSVHGCDHTNSEYGDDDAERLLGRSRQALERMDRLTARTGLAYDKVMVFPQGVFSDAALEAVKRAGFAAAVNTEVWSVGAQQRVVRVRDYWDMALVGSSGFPLFTRRHPTDGIENFAFDLVLGKPCLTVLHQGDFHGGGRQVSDFISKLTGLSTTLNWMSLGEIASRSVRQREHPTDGTEMEMYGRTARLTRAGDRPPRVRVRKREANPDQISEISVNNVRTSWTSSGGEIVFEAGLSSQETSVSLVYRDHEGGTKMHPGLRSRASVAARRYLCDFRDNWIRPRTEWEAE